MRNMLLIVITAAAAIAAGPGLAQQSQGAHPASAAAVPVAHSMEGLDAAAMHQMCKSEMGRKMDPKVVHEHSREKGGMAMWPNGKPLTKTEMAKMHEHCAAKMSTPVVEAPKKQLHQ